jgi:hypothetical protein
LYGREYLRLVDVVVGGQFGSEGKGQIAAFLSQEYDWLVRVGGPNAGHTVYFEPEPYTFHHLPSGANSSEAKLLIGPGAVLNVDKLLKEIADCKVSAERLRIDPQAIRDQKPMDDSGLKRALRDLSPDAWYRVLNSKVFFWLCEERLTTLLSARAYSGREHCVLVVDTRALVNRHEPRIWLAPMNTGCTKPMPHPRGSDTFQRIRNYPYAERRKHGRQPKQAVVELAVDHSVPDVRDFVLRVEQRQKNRVLATIWSR